MTVVIRLAWQTGVALPGVLAIDFLHAFQGLLGRDHRHRVEVEVNSGSGSAR
jgi:hypothetical protein